jgi:hypothetical protein
MEAAIGSAWFVALAGSVEPGALAVTAGSNGVAAMEGSAGPAEPGLPVAAVGSSRPVSNAGSAGLAGSGSAVATVWPERPAAMTASPWSGNPVPAALVAGLAGLPLTIDLLAADAAASATVAARPVVGISGPPATDVAGVAVGVTGSA